MKRRTLLASAGVGITSLTGCLFGGGGGGQSSKQTTSSGKQPLQNVDRSGAKLQLASISAPKRVPLKQAYTFSLTVKNTGDTAGVYRAPVTVRRGSGIEFEQEETALVYVRPGETQTAKITLSAFDKIGSANIRLGGANNQWQISVTEARFPFGGTFEAANADITVDRVELQPKRNTESKQTALVYLRVKATAEELAPPPRYFDIDYNGQSYSNAVYTNRTPKYESVSLDPGQTAAGIIEYTIPASASVDEIAVRYEVGDKRVVWVKPEGSGGTSGGTATTPTGSGGN